MLEPRTIGAMKAPQLANRFSLEDFATEHELVGTYKVSLIKSNESKVMRPK